MKYSTWELVCCPSCQSSLSLSAGDANGFVESGSLFCPVCNRSYPIINGIVHFIAPQELQGSNQRFARYYDRLAPFYSIFIKLAFLPFGGDRKARREILDHLDLKGGRLLEVSIGNGANLPYLFESPEVGEVFGLDISIGQLSRCRKLIEKHAWGTDLFLATAEALPFKTGTFDNVLHIGGINFFSNKGQAIKEMIRVAQPGSKIVIADEVERLAKYVTKSFDTTSPDQGKGTIETTILDFVPREVEGIKLTGIWKAHGKPHGYCLEFRKPG